MLSVSSTSALTRRTVWIIGPWCRQLLVHANGHQRHHDAGARVIGLVSEAIRRIRKTGCCVAILDLQVKMVTASTLRISFFELASRRPVIDDKISPYAMVRTVR
jgi:hypothetical protein